MKHAECKNSDKFDVSEIMSAVKLCCIYTSSASDTARQAKKQQNHQEKMFRLLIPWVNSNKTTVIEPEKKFSLGMTEVRIDFCRN